MGTCCGSTACQPRIHFLPRPGELIFAHGPKILTHRVHLLIDCQKKTVTNVTRMLLGYSIPIQSAVFSLGLPPAAGPKSHTLNVTLLGLLRPSERDHRRSPQEMDDQLVMQRRDVTSVTSGVGCSLEGHCSESISAPWQRQLTAPSFASFLFSITLLRSASALSLLVFRILYLLHRPRPLCLQSP